MLWLRLSVSHHVRRHVAPAAATEVRLVVVTACLTRVGVVFLTYGYTPSHSSVILQC